MNKLSKEDEDKYFRQMQDGIQMALEAAHHLGGRIEIKYDPHSARTLYETPKEELKMAERITNARRNIEVYKAMLNGATAKELKTRFNLEGTYIPGYYIAVQYAVEDQLKKKRYKKAPYQPRGYIGPDNRPMYDDRVHDVRPHKDFILKVIANAPEYEFLRKVLRIRPEEENLFATVIANFPKEKDQS